MSDLCRAKRFTMRRAWWMELVALGMVACGSQEGASSVQDAGTQDADTGMSMADAGPNDAGSSDAGSSDAGAGGNPGVDAGGSGGCNVIVAEHAIESGLHVAECSPIVYSTNPPSSGPHYGIWAAFQNYDFALPRGYFVHSMEHGAVVFSYNCPDGCAEDVAALEELVSNLPLDPLCAGTPAERRAIIVPDPKLEGRFAAAAWGVTLRADCIDAEEFRAFYLTHHGRAPENFCSPGQAFTTAAPGCGE